MFADITLRNEKNFIVNNIVKVIASGNPKITVENFDDFVFYDNTFYTFVGESTFVIRGNDILCVQFNV